MCCPSRFHPLSSVSPQTYTELEWHTMIWSSFSQNFIKKNNNFVPLPLESKWHCMGAAEPLLACRKIPAATSRKCTPQSSIFLWSGQAGVVPLWSPIPLIYTSCSFTVRRQRWCQQLSHDTAAWLKELGNRAICRGTQRCWFIGGGEKGILYLGSDVDALDITSLRFSGHEPLVIQTMTYAMQWLRGRRLWGKREHRGQQ